MADSPQTPSGSPPQTPSSGGPTNAPDALLWLERARAMSMYTDALKDSDKRVLDMFEQIGNQTQRAFEYTLRLYTGLTFIAIGTLIASVYIAVFLPTPTTFTQTFGVLAFVGSLITLIVLVYRNPVKNARHLQETVIKLNVIFLSFVRRLQQTDLVLRYAFMQDTKLDLNQIYGIIQEHQTNIEQTIDELNQILQDSEL